MASLLPNGKQYYVDNVGLPLVGGKVYTYEAGTTTPKATFADSDAQVPNTNPVVLDARGEATIFWEGSYRVTLKDSLDNIIWTVDHVTEPNSDVQTGSNGSLVVPSGTTPQRDAQPQAGYFRYNIDLDCFEGFYDPTWISMVKSVNGVAIPDGGNVLLKSIGGQSLLGTGDVQFKRVNGQTITGPGDIVAQQPLISGTNIKTIGGNSILGPGDISLGNPAASTLYSYFTLGGL